MPRLVAASISSTSKECDSSKMEFSWREAEEISRQLTQMRQGSSVGRSGEPTGVLQFNAAARMRAMVVLPMPRWPEKM